jgi:hypothetical protein
MFKSTNTIVYFDWKTVIYIYEADIFQYQSYSHSDDILIILKSNINTDTSIFVFSREKSHDSKYSKYASPKQLSQFFINSAET